MNRWARVFLWAFVVVSTGLFLVVSYDNTRQMAANFHSGWDLAPWLLAAAAEVGIIGCTIGRVVRKNAGLRARGFALTLAGVLTLSFLANLLAGAQAFLPQARVMDFIRARWYLAWPLVMIFAALVPVLIFSYSELFATLVNEASSAATPKRPRKAVASNAYRERILLLDEERPGLSAREVAGLLGCTPDTVRRARKSIEAGQRLQLGAPRQQEPDNDELW